MPINNVRETVRLSIRSPRQCRNSNRCNDPCNRITATHSAKIAVWRNYNELALNYEHFKPWTKKSTIKFYVLCKSIKFMYEYKFTYKLKNSLGNGKWINYCHLSQRVRQRQVVFNVLGRDYYIMIALLILYFLKWRWMAMPLPRASGLTGLGVNFH